MYTRRAALILLWFGPSAPRHGKSESRSGWKQGDDASLWQHRGLLHLSRSVDQTSHLWPRLAVLCPRRKVGLERVLDGAREGFHRLTDRAYTPYHGPAEGQASAKAWDSFGRLQTKHSNDNLKQSGLGGNAWEGCGPGPSAGRLKQGTRSAGRGSDARLMCGISRFQSIGPHSRVLHPSRDLYLHPANRMESGGGCMWDAGCGMWNNDSRLRALASSLPTRLFPLCDHLRDSMWLGRAK